MKFLYLRGDILQSLTLKCLNLHSRILLECGKSCPHLTFLSLKVVNFSGFDQDTLSISHHYFKYLEVGTKQKNILQASPSVEIFSVG